jgi:hypothetical protein
LNTDIAALAERLAQRLLALEMAVIEHMKARRDDPTPDDETLWATVLGYPRRDPDDR